MSAAAQQIKGSSPRIVLPVTLAAEARRSVLLRTGINPDIQQTFAVRDLTALDLDERAQLLDVWGKANVHYTDVHAPDWDGWWDDITDARNDGYLWLQRGLDGWTRYFPGTEGAGVDIDTVFFADGPNTISTLTAFSQTLTDEEREAMRAMLAGAPLIADIDGSDGLELEHVLSAYETAMGLAERLIALVDTGTPAPQGFRPDPYVVRPEGVFLYPEQRGEQQNRVAAVLKDADPEAYAQAVQLTVELDFVPDRQAVFEKVDRVCYHWWASHSEDRTDADKVDALLKMALSNAKSDVAGAQKKVEEAERYEDCRTRWISRHGSARLKRAAERGYKHDGIYRDERLAVELPDFVGSLGRKPEIRELINPSGEALEVESEVLARAEGLGISDQQVRLVFAQPGVDSDWADGEFVQIEDYLGRHAVWKSVSGETDNDKLPF